MKKPVCLALVAGIALLPVQAQQQDPPPIMTFGEGICVGLIIGVTIDITIVVGVNCYKKWKAQPPPYEPPPVWVITNAPPATTNSITNRISSAGTINSSNSVCWYQTPAGAMFDTTLEARGIRSESNWTPILTIRGWQMPSNLIVRLSAADGTPIVTNWIPGVEPYAISLPANLALTATNLLIRTVGQ